MKADERGGDNRHIRHALTAAVRGRVSKRAGLRPVPEDLRIDGKVCLVTGANSGLGKAVAIDLAGRGARVLMACRSGHPQAGEDVRRLSGSGQVEMLRVDLADLDSVARLCDELKSRAPRIDIAVLNAGLIPRRARRTPQGFEVMFAVHFLANRLLVDRLLAEGLIVPSAQVKETPRIVLVASEAHRSAGPIDFNRFGAFVDYGLRDAMKHYGMSKLHLCTYAQELSRRLNPSGEVRVAVHSLCPGPVATGIAREAPAFLQPLIHPLMSLLFLSPEIAARPVLYLCCAEEMGRRSGAYLHVMREKRPSPLARDENAGARLWAASEALLERRALGSGVSGLRPSSGPGRGPL